MTNKHDAPNRQMFCTDCRQVFDAAELDAWASKEDAPEADAFLCRPCHNRRPPSAWGPWECL